MKELSACLVCLLLVVSVRGNKIETGIKFRNVPFTWTSEEFLWIFGGAEKNDIEQSQIFEDFWKTDGINFYKIFNDEEANSLNSAIRGRGDGISWSVGNTLFLFGGYGISGEEKIGYLNDVWKYEGSRWTRIAGNNAPNFISKFSANVNPGGRRASASWFQNNRLWMFGGYGFANSNQIGALADMWTFENGNWSIVGDTEDSHWPSKRYQSCNWVDSKGNLWLFGGITSNLRIFHFLFF